MNAHKHLSDRKAISEDRLVKFQIDSFQSVGCEVKFFRLCQKKTDLSFQVKLPTPKHLNSESN